MADFYLWVLAYLIGSFPTAYLFGRALKKVDIRKVGSGNVGGMNVYRVAGLIPGIMTILIDIGKGSLGVLLALNLGSASITPFVCAFFVVLGHNFNLLLRFKGGKGLATAFGALLVLSPASLLYVVPFAIVLTIILKDINTAFGTAALLIPTIFWLQHLQWDRALLGTALAAIIVYKHIPDYRAYRQGRRQFLGGVKK